MDLDRDDLVAFRASGDRERLLALWNRHVDAAWRLAVRIAGPDADDALQDAALALVAAAARWRDEGEGSARAWFFAVVANSARKLARRRRGRRELVLDEASSSGEPVAGEDAAPALAALADLPEKYRLAVQLRYLDQLDFPAVAGALGVPERTARTRVSRGLERLRRLLGLGGAPGAAAGAGLLLAAIELPSAPARVVAFAARIGAAPAPAAAMAPFATMAVAAMVGAGGLAWAGWWYQGQPAPAPAERVLAVPAAVEPAPVRVPVPVPARVVPAPPTTWWWRHPQWIAAWVDAVCPDQVRVQAPGFIALQRALADDPAPWPAAAADGTVSVGAVLDAWAAGCGGTWAMRDGILVLDQPLPAAQREELMAGWAGADARVAIDAARRLFASGDRAAQCLVAAAAGDDDGRGRAARAVIVAAVAQADAADWAPLVGDAELAAAASASALRGTVQERDALLALAAVAGEPSAVAPLATRASEEAWYLRCRPLLIALGRVDHPIARSAIARRLAGSGRILWAACAAAAAQGHADFAAPLRALVAAGGVDADTAGVALARCDPTPDLATAWGWMTSDDPWRRAAAALLLVEHGSDADRDRLVQQLGSANPVHWTQRPLLHALLRHAPLGTVRLLQAKRPVLERFAWERRPERPWRDLAAFAGLPMEARRALAEGILAEFDRGFSLNRIGLVDHARVVAALDPRVRERLLAIEPARKGGWGFEEMHALITAWLLCGHSQGRQRAAALASAPAGEGEALTRRESTVRAFAWQPPHGEGGRWDAELLATLRGCLDPWQHRWVRGQTAIAIGSLGPSVAGPVARLQDELLADGHDKVRGGAGAFAWRHDGLDAGRYLAVMTSAAADPAPVVRWNVAMRLGEEAPAAGPDHRASALALLLALARDEHPVVRRTAARELRHRPPSDDPFERSADGRAETVRALETLIADPAPHVRDVAAAALLDGWAVEPTGAAAVRALRAREGEAWCARVQGPLPAASFYQDVTMHGGGLPPPLPGRPRPHAAAEPGRSTLWWSAADGPWRAEVVIQPAIDGVRRPAVITATPPDGKPVTTEASAYRDDQGVLHLDTGFAVSGTGAIPCLAVLADGKVHALDLQGGSGIGGLGEPPRPASGGEF